MNRSQCLRRRVVQPEKKILISECSLVTRYQPIWGPSICFLRSPKKSKETKKKPQKNLMERPHTREIVWGVWGGGTNCFVFYLNFLDEFEIVFFCSNGGRVSIDVGWVCYLFVCFFFLGFNLQIRRASAIGAGTFFFCCFFFCCCKRIFFFTV